MDLLESLVAREFLVEVVPSSIADDREFAFRHHGEREAILRQIDPARAVAYHFVVAQWLEFHLGSALDEHCARLARHFEAAEQSDKAGRYYLTAGNRARAQYAHARAAEYYRKGLLLLSAGDAAFRLEALHNFGDVLQHEGSVDART